MRALSSTVFFRSTSCEKERERTELLLELRENLCCSMNQTFIETMCKITTINDRLVICHFLQIFNSSLCFLWNSDYIYKVPFTEILRELIKSFRPNGAHMESHCCFSNIQMMHKYSPVTVCILMLANPLGEQ